MSSSPHCANCGVGNVIPHVARHDASILTGALTLNGKLSLCCNCIREFVALAAQTMRQWRKKK